MTLCESSVGKHCKCTVYKRWIHKQYSCVRGHLSLVVDGGLRCKRCDGRIQGADLAKYLVMDGETYGSVKGFCNLGDPLDGYGGADLAASVRIRNGWINLTQIMPFLTSRAPPLERKCQVYASYVRSSMIYGNQTRLLLADVGLKFERAYMQNFNSLT